MQKSVVATLFIFFGTVVLIGQETPVYRAPSVTGEQPLPKQIFGGVLNGKAVKLPPAQYPAPAMAVNASGEVKVEITIDENGKVVSATSVSGHPLLRGPAAEAAKKAIFKPTLLNNAPVRLSGTLVYKFPPELVKSEIDFTWFTLGLNLGAIRSVGTDSSLQLSTAQFAKTLPDEFSEEKQLLGQISDVAGAKLSEILNRAAQSIQRKLPDDDAWQFAIGTKVGEAVGISKNFMAKPGYNVNEDEFRSTMGSVAELARSAPASIPVDVVEKLEQFAGLASRSDLKFSEVLAHTFQSTGELLRLMMSKANVRR